MPKSKKAHLPLKRYVCPDGRPLRGHAPPASCSPVVSHIFRQSQNAVFDCGSGRRTQAASRIACSYSTINPPFCQGRRQTHHSQKTPSFSAFSARFCQKGNYLVTVLALDRDLSSSSHSYHKFYSPIPPAPFPAGEGGEPKYFFARGLRPLASPLLRQTPAVLPDAG